MRLNMRPYKLWISLVAVGGAFLGCGPGSYADTSAGNGASTSSEGRSCASTGGGGGEGGSAAGGSSAHGGAAGTLIDPTPVGGSHHDIATSIALGPGDVY